MSEAELRTAELPQLYVWDADAYKDSVNSYTLYRGIVLGISGLLALFLTIVFVVKGTAMFPATAALAWAVLIYLCIDFGFWNKVIAIEPGEDQMWRAGAEVFLAASLVIFTYTYLHLSRWHVRYKSEEFALNLDRLTLPGEPGWFLEIKARTWSARDAETKARLIGELVEILGAEPGRVTRTEYVDL